MLRVFFKKHDFDPDMLIRVMLIKKKRVPMNLCGLQKNVKHPSEK